MKFNSNLSRQFENLAILTNHIPLCQLRIYNSFLHSESCLIQFPSFQAEKEKGELEVELEHLKSAGNKSLPSVSKVRLSEMRLKREVTQLKQQLTLVLL